MVRVNMLVSGYFSAPDVVASGFLLSLSLVFVYACYKIKRRRLERAMGKMPSPPCKSYFLGHIDLLLGGMKTGPLDLNESIFQGIIGVTAVKDAQHGIICGWLGFQPIVLVYTPETAEPFLVSNTQIDKAVQYDFIKPWLGLGLLTSTRDKWRKQRKLLTPSFHFRILDDFLPIINEQAKVLCDLLEVRSRENKGYFDDIIESIAMCALDIICETAMGVKIKAQTNSDTKYVKAVHDAAEALFYRSLRPWLHFDFMFYRTESGRKFGKALNVLHSFTNKVIKERKEEVLNEMKAEVRPDASDDLGIKRRRAFLDTLLEQSLKHPGSLSEVDIREEVDTFMFEGHDTTTMALSWAVYLIGLHPEVQEKVHQELDSIFGDDKERALTMDDLKEMKYIECVVKEALRLYPSVPMIGRNIAEDTHVAGYVVPKGVNLIIFQYQLHRDPKHWPDPEKFEPDRFLPENNRNRHPFAYIPFSGGPRNCIGQKFALLEEKALLASLFRKFAVTSLESRDKMRLTPVLILKSKIPLKVRLEIR